MTTNKPGSVNQQPLYGCTSCYEDRTWPASDLCVYDGECWCELCWDESRWELPDRPSWNDLEPYTPALQGEPVALAPVAAQHRFRDTRKLSPRWSMWQPASIRLDRPSWEIDSRGYEVEYRLLYADQQPTPDVSALVEALRLAKEMFIANDLILPHTFEVIDEALEAYRKQDEKQKV